MRTLYASDARDGGRSDLMIMDDFDFVQSIYSNGLARKADELGVANLSVPERSVVLSWWAKGLLDNGGFAYLYETGADLDAISHAFSEIGLSDAVRACALSRIASERNSSNSSSSNVTRIDRVDEGEDERWRECDEIVWGLGEKFDAAVAAYIRENHTLFGA